MERIIAGNHLPICLVNLVDGSAPAGNIDVSVPERGVEHRFPAKKTIAILAAEVGVGLGFPIGSEIPGLNE